MASALQFVTFAVHFCVEFDDPAIELGPCDYAKNDDVLVNDFEGADLFFLDGEVLTWVDAAMREIPLVEG